MNEQFIKGIAQFIASSSELVDGLNQKVAALETELEVSKTQQKEAAAQPVLQKEAIASTVEKLIQASLLEASAKDTAIEKIAKDPAVLLKFLDRVSEDKLDRKVKPIGKAVEKTAAVAQSGRKSDDVYESTFSRLGSRV